MCTVTLCSLNQGFVLTSNRDEAVARETLSPRVYSEAGVKLVYPRDLEAGGTWIGLSEQKRAICLLNGGFEPHVRKPPYRKSRGLVVKDLLKTENVTQEVASYNFSGIEPFTCVIADYHRDDGFFELVWDGKQPYFRSLDPGSYIWSSSLLYSETVRRDREERFSKFKTSRDLNAETLLEFHASRGSEENGGLIINRGFLKTCSITQVLKHESQVRMSYQNLLEEEEPQLLKFSLRT